MSVTRTVRARLARVTVGGAVTVAALGVAFGGGAYAATGGPFVLGHLNTQNTPSTLVNTAPTAPALRLVTANPAMPNLTVSNAALIPNLNADRVDGLHASDLQRRVLGVCGPNAAITGINALGGVSCAALPQQTAAESAHRSFGPNPDTHPAGTYVTIVTKPVSRGFYVVLGKTVLVTNVSTGSDCRLTYDIGTGDRQADESTQPLVFSAGAKSARATHNLQRLLQFGQGPATLKLQCRLGTTGWFANDSSIIVQRVQNAVDAEVSG